MNEVRSNIRPDFRRETSGQKCAPPHRLKSLIYPFRSSLVQKITAIVFLSIIFIEAIILVPSYLRLEDQLIQNLADKGRGHAATMIRALDNSKNIDADFKNFARSMFALPAIKGVAFYMASGNGKCLVGELPSSTYLANFKTSGIYYLRQTTRLEVAIPSQLGGHAGRLIMRLDAQHIPTELRKFILRIVGLVIIISLFVTTVTMLVLNKMIILPILCLRNSLLDGCGDAWAVGLSWRGLALQNEIGDLYRTINSHLKAQRRTRSRLVELDHSPNVDISTLAKKYPRI